MKHTPFTKKNAVKRILICFFTIAFTVICISSFAMRSNVASAKNKLSMSDAIKTSAYGEMTRISQFLQSDDLDSVSKTLMDSIDSQIAEASIEISNEQRIQIKDTLEELISSLNEHGMIEYDSDGDLTELSKSYLSNAASYAATSVIGDGEVALSNTVLADLVSTDAIDTTVSKIQESYIEITSQLTDDNGAPLDLADMKSQLDTLEKGLIDKNGNQISVSKIALRVAALETMVTTLKNSAAASTDYSNLADETNEKLASIESELGSVQLSLQSSDASSDEICNDVDQLALDVSALALKLKDFNQSDLDVALSDLSKEISDRKTAVSTLQNEIDSITQNNTNITSALQTSVSGLANDLASLQTSVSGIKSEQLSSLETWRTGVNANITSLQKEVQTLGSTDTATAATLSSLNQSLSAVKGALNNSEQTLSGNIKALENSLAAVNSQLNSNTNSLSESLSDVKTQLSQINAQIYDSNKTYISGSYVTGSDGNTYKYVGPSNADASAIPDPTTISYDENGKSAFWEKVDSTNALSDQLATINQQTEKLENVLSASSYSETCPYTKGSYVYDEITGKFYECILDAPAGTSLSDANYWKEAANATGLSKALSDLVSANNLMQISMDQEVLNRIASEEAIQSQIRSDPESELEQEAGRIDGSTVYAKLGSLFKTILYLSSYIDSSVADEAANRESATQALQDDINSKVAAVHSAMDALQQSLSDSNTDNSAAIADAKSELEDALAALDTSLSGDISDLDSTTQSNIASLLGTVRSLQTTLQDADAGLAEDLESAKTALGSQLDSTKETLNGQISTLDASLSSAIDAEEQARADADAALQEQIHSAANTELEQKAGEIDGTTIFAKLGALLKRVITNEDKINAQGDRLSSQISDETRNRESATQTLQDDINSKVAAVHSAMDTLQESLSDSNTDNSAAIADAKSELEDALAALDTSLSGDISDLDSTTQSNIASLLGTVRSLQTTLQDADAGLAEDLESAKTALGSQLDSTKETLNGQISTLDASLSSAIDAEEQARADADAALQEQIHSAANTELEQKAGEIDGTTIFAKLGALLKRVITNEDKINAQGDRLSSQISDETRNRESATQTLQDDINIKVGNVNTAVQNLQTALNDSNNNNVNAIGAAKSELQDALSELDTALSRDISSLDTTTQDSIASVLSTVASLQSTLESADESLANDLQGAKTQLSSDLTTAKNTLNGQITALDRELDAAIEAEEQIRAEADAALQEQIHSAANTELEQVAISYIDGATVFAKMGSLYNTMISHKAEWNQALEDEADDRKDADAALQKLIKSGSNSALETAGNNVVGNTLFAKIGTLINTINDSKNDSDQQIASEAQTRSNEDTNIRNSIISATLNALEITARDSVAGSTVYAKLGTLSNTMASYNTELDGKITEEARLRGVDKTELQGRINTLQGTVNTEVGRLETAIANGDDTAKKEAKDNLNATLTALNQALTASEGNLGSDVSANILSVKTSTANLRSALMSSDSEIAQNLETAKTNFNTSIVNLNTSLSAEETARKNADDALQKQIKDGSNTSLENTGAGIAGDTLFAKMGTLSNTILSSKSELDTSIGNVKSELNTTISNVKTTLEGADSTNANNIKNTQDNLGSTLDAIYAAASGTDGSAGTTVTAKITNMKTAVSNMNKTLTDRIAAEETTRADAVTTLQNKISNGANATLENTAQNSITGTTVMAKLGSLYTVMTSNKTASDQQIKAEETARKEAVTAEKTAREEADADLEASITAITDADQWAQNITLKADTTSGTRIYGITNSDDYTDHNGWKMWKLSGASLGLTFKAGTNSVPESDVTINYVGSPAVVVEYKITDGYLKIYTPTVPSADLVISTIHVENIIN